MELKLDWISSLDDDDFRAQAQRCRCGPALVPSVALPRRLDDRLQSVGRIERRESMFFAKSSAKHSPLSKTPLNTPIITPHTSLLLVGGGECRLACSRTRVGQRPAFVEHKRRNELLDLRERTARANASIRQSVPSAPCRSERTRPGTLVKATMRHIEYCVVDGPHIQQCLGIRPDVSGYSASASRVLRHSRGGQEAARRNLSREQTPQLGPSLHVTSDDVDNMEDAHLLLESSQGFHDTHSASQSSSRRGERSAFLTPEDAEGN